MLSYNSYLKIITSFLTYTYLLSFSNMLSYSYSYIPCVFYIYIKYKSDFIII